jgi:hypothetical protein
MRLSFDSIEEVREFVKGLKGTRGGKAGDGEDGATGQAPQPLAPPAGGAAGFPGAGAAAFTPPGGGFPAGGAPTVAPEVAGLVQRISVRIDGAIASGQPADAARAWLAGQCGPETAAYTLDQLKTVAMPKLTVAALENIAKMMNA